VLFMMTSKDSNKLTGGNIKSDEPKKLSRNVTRRSILRNSGAVLSTATAGGAALGLSSRPARAFSCTEKDKDPRDEYQYGAHPDEGGYKNRFKLHHTGTLQWYDTCFDNYNDIKEVILVAGFTAAMEYRDDPYYDIEWSKVKVSNRGEGIIRDPQGRGHMGQYAHKKQDDRDDDFIPELSQWSAPLLAGLYSNPAGAIATAAAAAWEVLTSQERNGFTVIYDYEKHRATVGFGTMFKLKLRPNDYAEVEIAGTTSDSTSEGYQTYSRIEADLWRQDISGGSDYVKWDVDVENGYEMED
jgi:hypothetical protein